MTKQEDWVYNSRRPVMDYVGSDPRFAAVIGTCQPAHFATNVISR